MRYIVFQRYLSRKQPRHPRTTTRIQLTPRPTGRGDFSVVLPARRLWGPDRKSSTHPRYRRPAEELLQSAAGLCERPRGSGGLVSAGLLRSGGKLRRRRSPFFFFFFSCRMKELPHRLPLRQVWHRQETEEEEINDFRSYHCPSK